METPVDKTTPHQETGAAWDDAAAIYERDEASDIEMLRAGGSSLLAPERESLGDLSAWCGRAIHLQCAGGTDTLSLLGEGAASVVGVDISPRMIAVARRKSAALNVPAAWYCADVLDTPADLDGSADLVYTGRGALPWQANLGPWAQVAARLLQSGGRLFVFEGHPLDWVWDETAPEYRLDDRHGDYFASSPRQDRWPAPFLESAGSVRRAHEFHAKLSDIVNAVIGAGLVLERLDEYPDPYWNQFPHLPADLARRLPHTFSLLARKV